MNGLNQVILLGNVGKDPQVTTHNGDKKASFSLATNKSYTSQGEKKKRTDWHTICSWRLLADIVEKYVRKGDTVMVTGELRYNKSEKDGETKYFTEIMADKVIIVNRGDGHENRVQADTPDTSGGDDLPF
jgi:single-strand DNA-binding protein